MSAELLVLRVVHVLGGIFWVGGGLYSALFIVPALAAAGPAMGPVMAELQRRRLFTVLPVVAVLTMLSGLRLLWIVSGGFAAAYFSRATGLTYAVSGAASLAGFLIAMVVARPASMAAGVLQQLLATVAPEARAEATRRLEALKRRAAVGTAAAVWLLVIAALGMAVARYL